MTAEMYQFHDGDDEADERLLKLTRQDMKSAARLLALILEAPKASSVPLTVEKPAPTQSPTREELLQVATWIFRARKRRDKFFHPGLFGEAAWDVLLALYIMDQGGPRLTIAALAKAADVPTTTILRWMLTLESQGLIVRQAHPNDRRSALISIAPKGRQAMESYLSETLASNA